MWIISANESLLCPIGFFTAAAATGIDHNNFHSKCGRPETGPRDYLVGSNLPRRDRWLAICKNITRSRASVRRNAVTRTLRNLRFMQMYKSRMPSTWRSIKPRMNPIAFFYKLRRKMFLVSQIRKSVFWRISNFIRFSLLLETELELIFHKFMREIFIAYIGRVKNS